VAQPYDDQKRAAVLAALLAGQSVSQVARDYNVSRGVIINWRDKSGIRPAPVTQEKADEIGELVANVLHANLYAVQVLAERVAAEEEWFRKQSASDLAVLSGVLTDKSVRILEALESASSSPEPGGDVDAVTPPGAA
jgi:transposase-like protein